MTFNCKNKDTEKQRLHGKSVSSLCLLYHWLYEILHAELQFSHISASFVLKLLFIYSSFAISPASTVVLLTSQEFEMDSEIKRHLLAQKDATIAKVKEEMAWEAAKHDRALKKLKSQ